MNSQKINRTYADGSKHIVYYIQTKNGIPSSFGWDKDELSLFVKEDRDLSMYVKIHI